MNRLFYAICVFAAFFVSCGSVAGLVDGAGRLVDGSGFTEKTVEAYGTAGKRLDFRVFSMKDGERAGVFTLKTLPGIRFYCTEPDETGCFFVTRARFLFSGTDGWQEGDMDASGIGRFVRTGPSRAEFSLEEGVEFGGVSRGAINRLGRRIDEERAAVELQNRKERVEAAVEWMRGRSGMREFASQKDFEKYWTPVFFPETVSKKSRPPLYNRLTGSNESIYGEGVMWNAAYTKEVFPEHLRHIRDSGSLLRDWNEAGEWFYVEYSRNETLARLSGVHYLVRLNR
jgi:hypothetical protein